MNMPATTEIVEPMPQQGTALTPRPALSPAVTPAQMIMVAIERGADVAMLERLMALQERWEANEARKAFVAAFAEFKKVRPVITKNKHVGFKSKRTDTSTNYDHATIDNVCDSLDPALSAHGFTYVWKTDQAEGRVRVTCTLTHVLGHSESVSLEAARDDSGNKNHIQAVGSAATYLSRYTLLLITGCVTRDQDDDGRKGGGGDDDPPISAAQKDELIALMKKAEADTAAFLAHMKVETLDAMPASLFSAGKLVLERRAANRAAKGAGS